MADDPSHDSPSRTEIEEGLRFLVHRAFQSTLTEGDLTAGLRALIETLVEQGVIKPELFERKRKRLMATEGDRISVERLIQLDSSGDKYQAKSPDIDCVAIMPICKARCCKFAVNLSAQDLDEGGLQWDYGRPYQIRRKDDGYCTHSEVNTHRCGVYKQRPHICRVYDCRQDARIWVDFDKRILAEDDDDNTRTV